MYKLDDKSLSIRNSDESVKVIFFENGSIEFVGEEDACHQLLYENLFKGFFGCSKHKKWDNTVKFYDSILINTYLGTIKYIGSYYKELPAPLKRFENKLQRMNELKSFW